MDKKIIEKKFIKNLVNKKLSTLVEKYNFDISQFLDDDDNEMTSANYEMLKNHKVDKVDILDDDYNYDFIIHIDKFDFYGIFDI